MNTELKNLNDAVNQLNEHEKNREQERINKLLEIIIVCQGFYDASKLSSGFRKQKLMDDTGFSSMDDVNDWIRLTERNFLEMIERLKKDML